MSKKVLLAGYQKSGNTWLGYMLSYILGARYIDLHARDSKPTLQKEILKLIEGNLPHKSDYEAVCKTHDRYSFIHNSSRVDLEQYDKVVCIVRDPRDVAVSRYYFNYYNMPIAVNKPENVLSNKSWFTRKYYWKKTVFSVARNWNFHVMSWRTFEGRIIVKYEDLHRHCLKALKEICCYLEVSDRDDYLEDAIDFFSFDKLSGGRKRGEEYQTAFFRKGIVGDYKNHFSWIDSFIMKRYAGREMRDLEYVI